MKKNHIYGIAIALSLLAGIWACAASPPDLKKEIISGQIPRFEGSIKPLREPLYPRYRPFKGSFHHSIVIYTKYPDKESHLEITQQVEMTGDYMISNFNQFLVWLIQVDQMIVDGTPYNPSMPLVETQILTDKQGKVKEIELAAPALSKSNVDDADIEKYIEQTMQSVAFLSNGPIRSGDVITELTGKVLPEKLMRLLKETQTNPGFEYRVQGWSTHKGRKVIVAALHEDYADLSDKSKQVFLEIKMNGYNLYDSETYQVLKGVRLLEINQTLRGGNKYQQKILFHQSADFAE